MFWFLSISEMVFSIWLPIFTVINRLNLEILIRFHSKEMQIFLQIFLPSLSRNTWDEPDFFSPVNISAETETISLLLLFLPCFRVQGKRNFQTFAYFPLSRGRENIYRCGCLNKRISQPDSICRIQTTMILLILLTRMRLSIYELNDFIYF